jgi:excisionase family DNA binding protein
MTNKDEKEKISVKQAAKVAGVSRQQVYNLIRDDKVEYDKPAHEVWIDKKSLLEYIASRGK